LKNLQREVLDIRPDTIKAVRESRGWSATELARRAGVAVPTIYRIERGDGVQTRTLDKVRAALAEVEK
jgi:transcriptional regulator with XRE-family HTH domain